MYKYIFLGENIFPISTYNVILGIGIIVFFKSLERVIGKNGIPFKLADEIKTITPISALFGLCGAALAEALYHRQGNEITFSGFTFYGGLVASFLSLWIICRFKKIDFLYVANILALPLSLAHTFGRMGCFFGGCCYGLPTDSSLGVAFPPGSLPFAHYGAQELHPTQMYESFLLFLMSLALMKTKLKYRFIVYLLVYPIIRIVVEIFRGDDRGILLGEWLSPSQEISLILFFLGVALLYRRMIMKKLANQPYFNT